MDIIMIIMERRGVHNIMYSVYSLKVASFLRRRVIWCVIRRLTLMCRVCSLHNGGPTSQHSPPQWWNTGQRKIFLKLPLTLARRQNLHLQKFFVERPSDSFLL